MFPDVPRGSPYLVKTIEQKVGKFAQVLLARGTEGTVGCVEEVLHGVGGCGL